MNVLPILAALRRHKIAALLIVFEIALAFAIVSNAVYLVMGRLQRMDIRSGIDDRDLVVLRLTSMGKADGVARAKSDLAVLRTIPGVRAAAISDQTPFTDASWNAIYAAQPGQLERGVRTTTYFGDPELMETMGVRLLQGRWFNSAEYVDLTSEKSMQVYFLSPLAIVSEAYAQRLWPGQSAVGKTMYIRNHPVTVIGVMSDLIRPYVSAVVNDPGNDFSIFLPFRMGPEIGGSYVLRCTR